MKKRFMYRGKRSSKHSVVIIDRERHIKIQRGQITAHPTHTYISTERQKKEHRCTHIKRRIKTSMKEKKNIHEGEKITHSPTCGHTISLSLFMLEYTHHIYIYIYIYRSLYTSSGYPASLLCILVPYVCMYHGGHHADTFRTLVSPYGLFSSSAVALRGGERCLDIHMSRWM